MIHRPKLWGVCSHTEKYLKILKAQKSHSSSKIVQGDTTWPSHCRSLVQQKCTYLNINIYIQHYLKAKYVPPLSHSLSS